MVHLSQVILLAEGRVEDVVEVDREDLLEPAAPGRVDGVACVVGRGPGVGPASQAPVGQEVENILETSYSFCYYCLVFMLTYIYI